MPGSSNVVRRTSWGILPGSSAASTSSRVPWRRASARSVPRARSVPNGRVIRAAQIESRPNRVRYQGEPAAAKTSVGSRGSLSSRCRRSVSECRTVRTRCESGESTRTSVHGTSAAPAAASNGVVDARVVLRSRCSRTVPPGGSTTGQRATRPRPSGSSSRPAPGAPTCVECRSSPQVACSAPTSVTGSGAVGADPDLTSCSSAPSPRAVRMTSQRTVSPAREVTATCSAIPDPLRVRVRRTSTVGSGPGSPTLRARRRHCVVAPSLAATTPTGGTPSTVRTRWLSTRRSSTYIPVAAPSACSWSMSPVPRPSAVTFPCTAVSRRCSQGCRERGRLTGEPSAAGSPEGNRAVDNRV